jgi:MFS transporter, OHS family, lactose permease
VAALMAGFLFTVNPLFNFIGGSIFGVLCLAVQLFWKTDHVPLAPGHSAHPKTPSVREMVGVLAMPKLWTIIAFVLLSWTFYNLYDQQMFPDFYTSLFESKERGEQVYGVLNATQVFVEGGMMMLVPLVMRKVGVRTTLLLGVSVMCMRILGSAVFDDAVLISIVKMFHAIEVPLFILGIFRYITLHFKANLSATLYLVGFEVSAQVGNVLLSRPFGSLRDAIGYQPTFYVISGAVFLAGCWAYFALKRDDQDVEGDPIGLETLVKEPA